MTNPARTYNQSHVARRTDGKRRISIYWTWSYPWEVQRDPALMENRFSTITEVRNVLWPAYETPAIFSRQFSPGYRWDARAVPRFRAQLPTRR